MPDKAQQLVLEEAYPFWRFHMWETGQGSYEAIEQKVQSGDMLLWTCTDPKCDCMWTKTYCEFPRARTNGD